MKKIAVDLSKVAQVVNQKKTFKYDEVKHQLKKVAYDVVRFIDGSDIEGLWRIQKDDNGEYIVATYQQDLEKIPQEKFSSDWSTVIDRENQIHIFYKNQNVKKISLASIGLSDQDPNSVAQTVRHKLASDQNFVHKLIDSLEDRTRQVLLTSNPELKK